MASLPVSSFNVGVDERIFGLEGGSHSVEGRVQRVAGEDASGHVEQQREPESEQEDEREAFDEASLKNEVPVLLTSPQIRPFVRSIIERFRAQTSVALARIQKVENIIYADADAPAPAPTTAPAKATKPAKTKA